MRFYSREISAGVLGRDADACCVLDGARRFLYCNAAWDRFGELNGGGESAHGASLEGRNLLDFIPAVLKTYFDRNLPSAILGRELFSHEYECSSPTLFRVYRLQALRLKDTHEILICHSLLAESPHNRYAVEPDPDAHVAGGMVRMCSHCRKTKRGYGSALWDWVPAFVAKPPEQRVDDLCPDCRTYYETGEPPWKSAT